MIIMVPLGHLFYILSYIYSNINKQIVKCAYSISLELVKNNSIPIIDIIIYTVNYKVLQTFKREIIYMCKLI